MIKIFCFAPHALLTGTKTKQNTEKRKHRNMYRGKMLPTKSNANLIYKNVPFNLACQKESVKIYTQKLGCRAGEERREKLK